jgi:hypothetical protein
LHKVYVGLLACSAMLNRLFGEYTSHEGGGASKLSGEDSFGQGETTKELVN